MHPKMKRGDKFEAVLRPVAQAVDWVLGTDLQNCGGCKSMRDNLNLGMSITGSAITRWFNYKQEQGETMEQAYVITEQSVVENATSTRDALAKHLAGNSVSIALGAQMKPTMVQRGDQPGPKRVAPDAVNKA